MSGYGLVCEDHRVTNTDDAGTADRAAGPATPVRLEGRFQTAFKLIHQEAGLHLHRHREVDTADAQLTMLGISEVDSFDESTSYNTPSLYVQSLGGIGVSSNRLFQRDIKAANSGFI